MKKCALLSVAGMAFLLLAGSAGAQCPEQPNDNGVCDTLYVERYDSLHYSPGPWQVRFPLLVTNDITDPAIDSISGMVNFLCFTSSNPTADARIEPAHNNTNLHSLPDLDNSIFRHLPGMEDPQIHNWMMDLSEQETGLDWDCRVLDLGGGTHFWLSLIPCGTQDQRFSGGSRVLLATATFTLDDTTRICIDTCFTPIGSGVTFSRADAVTYRPRDNMPYCAGVRYNDPCPDQDPNDNGACDSFHVDVYPKDQYQVSFPAQVRFPMRVTSDIPDPYVDSVAGMTIPLCYSSSNPAANAVPDPDYNNINLHPSPDLNRSVFRHLPSMEYPTERNFMMDLSEAGLGLDWDTRILDLGGTHMWMSLIPTGTPDQRFPGGNRVLTVTATFTVEDTTTICIDTCFWPPGWGWIVFFRTDAVSYVPRWTMPYCVAVQLSERGDATGDGVINIADVMYMINYLYRSGPYPISFEAGDANCDGDHSLLDVVFLINYLYKGGPPPGC